MQSKIVILGLGIASATFESAFLDSADYKFMDYVSKFGKSYGTTTEFEFRSKLFKQKNWEIEVWNSRSNDHKLEHNKFSDWTRDEMKRLLGDRPAAYLSEPTNLDSSNLAQSVDWRTKGAVTPVKDQGHCGSCWSFSVTGAIEAAYFLHQGKLQSFSEQQLVDCSNEHGCNGGDKIRAMKWVESHPLQHEADYTYTAKDGTCQNKKSKAVGTVKNVYEVKSLSVDQMKAALNKSTVSVSVQADQTAFHSYKSGVITSGCGTATDHAILAVGYGTENGVDYWLVKNSWGTGWGEHGYVKIGQQGNPCGILNHPAWVSE
jgi:C1A family cysteine protease